jgi:DNA-binding response OmpR family regulator
VKRVLVVDDDDDMRGLMVFLLGDRYEVVAARDGEEGLALAKSLRPDLIVLDLLMPRMHGFEVVRKIRGDAALKTVKVLIASSKSYAHDVSTAVAETGADDYIVKPFDLDAFKVRVDKMLDGAS